MALICAFCTDTITDNSSVNSSQSLNYLQTFYSEFLPDPPKSTTNQLKGVGGNINVPIKIKNNVPSNWSICPNCFSSVQLLLKSKRAVDKVESQVRKLQLKLLNELKSLSKEVDIMSSNMVVMEGILRRNADDYFPNVWKKENGKMTRKTKDEIEDETNLVENFRDKVLNVFQDFQTFKMEINQKLLPVNPVKYPDNQLSFKSIEDVDQNSEDLDNMSNFDMEDNPLESAYQEDKVKQEILDNDQDNQSLNSDDDDDTDEEFQPKKKIKPSTVWKPGKSKKKDNPYTCDICLKPLKNGGDLRSHIWSHLSPAEKEDPANEHLIPLSIYCKICRKEFPSKHHLKRHQTIHLDPEQREKIICQDCGIQILAPSFAIHKKHHCIDSTTFSRHGVKCPICEKLQKNTRFLVKHLYKEHPDDKHYPCDICGARFRTKGAVGTHKKIHDDQRAGFLCEGCGRDFKSSTSLKRHEKNSCPGSTK